MWDFHKQKQSHRRNVVAFLKLVHRIASFKEPEESPVKTHARNEKLQGTHEM